jgi:hypothetical protein
LVEKVWNPVLGLAFSGSFDCGKHDEAVLPFAQDDVFVAS